MPCTLPPPMTGNSFSTQAAPEVQVLAAFLLMIISLAGLLFCMTMTLSVPIGVPLR